MASRRNRIMYASQSVYCNGEVLYRVQTMGSTTTFTSTDIFELGHLDVIDVVDDVPAVAVTLNTNDWGDVRTFALLAQVSDAKVVMTENTTNDNANLVVVSGTQNIEIGPYLHGACLADFAIVCGNLPGVAMWSPIQSECDLGTLSDNIDQTMFMDDVYVNRVEFNYSTGAEATENYTGETDNKMWLLNEARFINFQDWVLSGSDTEVNITLSGTTASGNIATLSDGSLAFMRTSEEGYRGVVYYDNHSAAPSATVWRVEPGTIAVADWFIYDEAEPYKLYFPTNLTTTVVAGDKLSATFASQCYNSETQNCYFKALDAAERYPVGALRQGQIELYIVGPTDASYRGAWRLTSAVLGADLTREPLSELGHLNPYDRPLTLPIPVTANLETTAGDLEQWSMFADKYAGYSTADLLDLDLTDLMTTDYLKLVIMVYAQTDEEAGGSGPARKVLANSGLIGKDYIHDGTTGTYSLNDTEYPLKTIIVDNLKITEEGCNLDVGTNATQTFNFKTNNDVFVVKGGVSIDHVTDEHRVRRNS